MNKNSKRKIFRIVWFSLVAIFLTWTCAAFQSRNLPANTFISNEKVQVTEDADQVTFKAMSSKKPELIFFQGGLTDPKAYAPLCRKLAESGFTCHLIKMSWRLAILDYKKISKLYDLKNGNYVIGGHSQGAKMATQFVYENPGVMKGLFLLGTSHPRDIDLSNITIPTIKLYAENDGLASMEEVLLNKSKLPRSTKLVLIKGGNHSQFGYLGKLLGDDKAGISLQAQQAIVFENLLNFILEIEST